MTSHYFLTCSISADVRQSVQIKFDDLKLPKSVIETLEKNNTVSLRPNLSNALKTELDSLRVMQRELYDNFCIHYGDAHFVTESYFFSANNLIREIRSKAKEANDRLKDLWESEYNSWQNTAENILRPLFSDDMEYTLALGAYMKFFPTRVQYQTPIRVQVLGPLPVSLQQVEKPIDNDLNSLMSYENQINTQEVLDSARKSAADRALLISAELLDDLDARGYTKIGKQQTGSSKKRGSWQVTAEKLKLISNSVPGFDVLTELAEKLLRSGNDLLSHERAVKNDAVKMFFEVQDEIRNELTQICNNRETSSGLEKLKSSLALSSTYKTLCSRIKTAENSSSLNLLMKDVSLELDIYEQRSKQLKKLIKQRKELVGEADENLEVLITEVKHSVTSTELAEAEF